MIVSAMIFAGLTLIIGVVLGFLLGQAKGRMSYEERLRDVEAARAALERHVGELERAARASVAPQQAPADPPSQAAKARG